jgi:hypothetical protein
MLKITALSGYWAEIRVFLIISFAYAGASDPEGSLEPREAWTTYY